MKPLVVLIAALLCGCASKPPPMKTIRFESEPAGARVFHAAAPDEHSIGRNREYLGTTPFTWTTEINDDGSFKTDGVGVIVYSMFVPCVTLFTAELTNATRTAVYHSGNIVKGPDKAPSAIFFDFSKPAP